MGLRERYNSVLAQIERGDAALRRATDEQREVWYPRFLALLEELRDLYNAIGEPLADPWEGYP